MKKIILMTLLAILLSISSVYAKVAIIGPITALTGGGTNSLDGIECEDILNDNSNRAIASNDCAIVIVSGSLYFYQYDSTGSDAEQSPFVIVPNDRADCGNTGQWNLVTTFNLGRSSNPKQIFRDSDCTDFDDNVYWSYNCTDTGSGTEDCDATLHIQIAGVDTSVITVDADGSITFGLNTIVSRATSTYQRNVPQNYTVTDDVDSATLGSELTSSIVLITGDNDSDNDEIDLQDGLSAGDIITFIIVANCDADDTMTIDAEEDSTCTGCPNAGVFTFDNPGDMVTLVWSGSAWFYVGSYEVE